MTKRYTVSNKFNLILYEEYLLDKINSKWGYSAKKFSSIENLDIIEVTKKHCKYYVKINLDNCLLSIKVSEKLESTIMNSIYRVAENYFYKLLMGRSLHQKRYDIKILGKLQNFVYQYTDKYIINCY